MTQYFQIHPENPQAHLIRQAAGIIRTGGVIVYPTDSGYALGGQMGNKVTIDRIKRIRQLDDKHYMTLICRDLSELSTYAQVDNRAYRLLKAHTPGAYTFILPATREVPRRLQHPHRKTIGLRVPDNIIVMALLETLEEPMLSSTLILPGVDTPLIEPEAMRELLGRKVDLIIDGGTCGLEPTTVVDLVDGVPKVVRNGKGDPTPFL
jgi:tRNA threonylcarbamoyl adenosine modification protein (Sua5/YciO/YrdC/YwlC family)